MLLTPTNNVRTPDAATPVTEKDIRAYEDYDSGGRHQCGGSWRGTTLAAAHRLPHGAGLGDSADHLRYSGNGRQDRSRQLERWHADTVESKREDVSVRRGAAWQRHASG